MKLVEIIKSDNTNVEKCDFIHNYLEEILGKGVVVAKDTPNFIANRIGVMSGTALVNLTIDYKMSIEEVDAITNTYNC